MATRLDPAEVCTLSPAGLSERIAWIRKEILPHARRTERLEAGLAWELDAAPGLANKLDHLIALERECCSGIVFERFESATRGRVRLEVRGIDPDAEAFRSLGAPGAGRLAAPSRLAKAAGVGVVASGFVCCVLPAIAAALLGSIAAPLAALDGPGPIAVGALVAGGGAWWWLGHRRLGARSGERPAGAACGPGC